MQLPQRLKQCRQSKKLTQKNVALFLEIAERSYQHYELGEREPTLTTMVKLADYFDVSLDYLVGRTDNPDVNK